MSGPIPVSSLIVRIKGSNADLKKTLKDSTKDTEKAGGKMAAGMKVAAAGFTAVTAAAAATTAGIVAIVAKNTQLIDNLAKSSDRLGTTTEALAGLRWAGKLTDVSQQDLQKSIEKSTRRIGMATAGYGAARKSLKQLGLDSEELAKKSPDRAFEDITEALAGIPNAATRSAIGFDIFGNQAQKLTTLTQGGKKGLRELREEAEFLGLEVSRGAASLIEGFNDNLDRMTALADGAGRQFTVGLAPALNIASEEIVKLLSDVRGGPDAFKSFGESVGEVIIDAVVMFSNFGNSVQQVFAEMAVEFDTYALVLAETTNQFIDITNAMLDTVVKGVGGAMDSFLSVIQSKLEKFKHLPGVSFFIEKVMEARSAVDDFAVSIDHVETGGLKQDLDTSKHALIGLRKEAIATEKTIRDKFGKAKRTANAPSKRRGSTGLLDGVAKSREEVDAEDRKAKKRAEKRQKKHKEKMEKLSPWQAWIKDMDDMESKVEEFSVGAFQSFADQLGDAVAQVFVLGESFEETFAQVGKAALAELVSGLVSVVVQMGVTAIASKAMTASGLAVAQTAMATTAAESAIAGAAVATSWQAAAINASIATYGAAAGVGAAAYGVALAGAVAATSIGNIAIGASELAGSALAGAGQAHDGLTQVPRTGSYILEGGEAVIKRSQNEDLREFLAENRRQPNASAAMNVTINNHSNSKVEASQGPGGLTVVIRAVEDAFARSVGTNSGGFNDALRRAGFRRV